MPPSGNRSRIAALSDEELLEKLQDVRNRVHDAWESGWNEPRTVHEGLAWSLIFEVACRATAHQLASDGGHSA